MFLPRKPHLLLAAALCVSAGGLSAQRTQRVATDAAQRLRDQGVTLRVGPGGVDTVSRTGALAVRPGEMIVNVTAARPTRLRRPAAAPTGGEVSGTASPGPSFGPADGPEPVPPSADSTPTEIAPPVNAPPPAASDPIAYDMGYQIGVDDARGDHFHVLTAIVEIEEGGLRYDPGENAYVGSILIGLIDREHPAESDSLARDVVVQLTGEMQSVDVVRLRTINIPFTRVAIRVPRPRADSVQIRVRPAFHPAGQVIWIPVRRATLSLHASPRRIAGFGLEVAELIVMNADNNDTVPVVLASVRAKPKPLQVQATREGGVSRIRSAGVGTDTVRLAGGAYQGFAVIEYGWPVSFLLAALIGGLAGGVLNALSSRRRRSRRVIRFLAAQGALTGAVGAILYAVGINVVGWAPDADYGEGLMFAVAFVCGLMGPRIFDRFLPRMSAGGKGGDDPPPSAPPPAPAPPSASEPAAVG